MNLFIRKASDQPGGLLILPTTKTSAMTKTTKMSLCIIILSFIICQMGCVQSARTAPAPIEINKCCRNGEQLDEKQQCLIGSSEKWWPPVYQLQKQKYFSPAGEAPRFFHVRELSRPNCESPEFINHHNHFALFSNGTLYLGDRSATIDNDKFCVDKDTALVCAPESNAVDQQKLSVNYVKIRKCCSQKAIYEAQSVCVPLGDGHEILSQNLVKNTSQPIEYRYGFPQCTNYSNNNIAIVGKFNESKFDDRTGDLMLPGGVFQPNQYCLEHYNDSDSINVHVFMCAENLPETKAEMASNSKYELKIIGGALLISVVFLITTLATGFLLPTNHHVLHWRCQTYYVSCLIIGDILLAIVQLSGSAIRVKSAECVSIAISVHFFYLVAFFWLNTMCFNIWWTFRDFRPSSLEKVQELVRLRIYQAYAWGVPLVIIVIAIILDNLPDGDFLRPRFGQTRCGFDGDKELLAYFFGPVGFLLFVNLLLFASTARQLTCGLWKRDDVKSTTERSALGKVCMKLVVVMGITWVTDVISWVHATLDGGDRHPFWIVPDLINALHGVFIFMVVGCQPQVLMAIKRFWSSKIGRNVTNTTNGPQHSSSSQGLPSIGESVTNNTFTNHTFTTTSKAPLETIC